MDHEERRDFHAKFEEALSFVCRLHAEQTRNQADISYIPHPIRVAGLATITHSLPELPTRNPRFFSKMSVMKAIFEQLREITDNLSSGKARL